MKPAGIEDIHDGSTRTEEGKKKKESRVELSRIDAKMGRRGRSRLEEGWDCGFRAALCRVAALPAIISLILILACEADKRWRGVVMQRMVVEFQSRGCRIWSGSRPWNSAWNPIHYRFSRATTIYFPSYAFLLLPLSGCLFVDLCGGIGVWRGQLK